MIDFVSAKSTCCRTTGSYCADSRATERSTPAAATAIGWLVSGASGDTTDQLQHTSSSSWAMRHHARLALPCHSGGRGALPLHTHSRRHQYITQSTDLAECHLVLDRAWVLLRRVKETTQYARSPKYVASKSARRTNWGACVSEQQGSRDRGHVCGSGLSSSGGGGSGGSGGGSGGGPVAVAKRACATLHHSCAALSCPRARGRAQVDEPGACRA